MRPAHASPAPLRALACGAMRWAAALALGAALATPAGAAEYYVDAARPDDSGDGLSWATAKQTIQAAIDASADGDVLLVKYGDYSIGASLQLTSDRKITSDDGTHDSYETAVPDRSACTVLASGASRVLTVTGSAVTFSTFVRGLTITGGNATTESPGTRTGGGIYVGDGAEVWIEGCLITDNTAGGVTTAYGGGAAAVGAGTRMTLYGCRVSGNVAATAWYGYGGGVFAGDGAYGRVEATYVVGNTASTARVGYGGGIAFESGSGLILGSWITDNVGAGPAAGGGGRGGGVYVGPGDYDVLFNTIEYNHASEAPSQTGRGGGVYTAGTGDINVNDNLSISHNTASTAGPGYGGGVECGSSGTDIHRNPIAWNVASSSTHPNASDRIGQGGGMFMTTYSGNRMTENVLLGNTASLNGTGSGGGMYYATSQTLTNNVFAYNVGSQSADGSGGGVWLYNAGGGQLVNNVFYRNANKSGLAGAGNGSALYYSSGGSPAIANNIFMGHDIPNSDGVAVYCVPAKTLRNNAFHRSAGADYTANVTSLDEVLGDPRMLDPEGGDYALDYDSPCIEEGDPTYALPPSGGWVVDIGAFEYTGDRHQRAIPDTGLYLFGGRVRAKAHVTTLGTLSEIDMIVHRGETHALAPSTVERWYEIASLGDGMVFDLTLSYTDGEASGMDESSLAAWRLAGSGWEGPKPSSVASLAENWLTVAGQTQFSDWVMSDGFLPADVDDPRPRVTALAAIAPNPFGGSTRIAYRLAAPSRVRFEIYDLRGARVRTLLDADRPAGDHGLTWDGADDAGRRIASGVYFCRMEAGGYEAVRKVVRVR